MACVDTSALLALIVNEPRSAAVARWYGRVRGELVSALWCVTEFASALGIKQRTGQLDQVQAESAWARLGAPRPPRGRRPAPAAAGAGALPPGGDACARRVDRAAAGDALHLACAEQAGARRMATRDDVLDRNAKRLKIEPVAFS